MHQALSDAVAERPSPSTPSRPTRWQSLDTIPSLSGIITPTNQSALAAGRAGPGAGPRLGVVQLPIMYRQQWRDDGRLTTARTSISAVWRRLSRSKRCDEIRLRLNASALQSDSHATLYTRDVWGLRLMRHPHTSPSPTEYKKACTRTPTPTTLRFAHWSALVSNLQGSPKIRPFLITYV